MGVMAGYRRHIWAVLMIFVLGIDLVWADDEHRAKPGSSAFVECVLICVGLVLTAGVMSGLTVGLMSIDPLQLELQRRDGTDVQKQRAAILSTLLNKHHWLLVTLLLSNAAAMEALPLFLDRIVPSYVAVILSVTLVLLFGEVIPQALCTSRPIEIGARFAPLVRGLMYITAPISLPLAKLLDCVLGEHGGSILFKRSELKTLIALHGSNGQGLNASSTQLLSSLLHEDEVTSMF
jgi:metal transporter CNNM